MGTGTFEHSNGTTRFDIPDGSSVFTRGAIRLSASPDIDIDIDEVVGKPLGQGLDLKSRGIQAVNIAPGDVVAWIDEHNNVFKPT